MNTQSIILLVFSIIFLIFSSIEIYFCFKNEKLRKYFKGIPILILIILSICLFPNEPLIYVALIFGLLGDLFLISRNKQMFFVGTCCFLTEHILIAVKLFLTSNIKFDYPFYLVLLGFVFMYLFFGFIFLKKHMKTPYVVLSSIYALALTLCLVSSISFAIYNKKSLQAIISVGYLIFIISDLLVMQKRFIKKYKFHQPAIMVTYYIAQYLILLFFALSI